MAAADTPAAMRALVDCSGDALVVGPSDALPDLGAPFDTVVIDLADGGRGELAAALVSRVAPGGHLVVALGHERSDWQAAIDALDASGRTWAVGDTRADAGGVLHVTLVLDAEPSTDSPRELLHRVARVAEESGAIVGVMARRIELLADRPPAAVAPTTDPADSSKLLMELERARADLARTREQLVKARDQLANARDQLVLTRERLATSQEALRSARASAAAIRSSKLGRAVTTSWAMRRRVRRIAGRARRALIRRSGSDPDRRVEHVASGAREEIRPT